MFPNGSSISYPTDQRKRLTYEPSIRRLSNQRWMNSIRADHHLPASIAPLRPPNTVRSPQKIVPLRPATIRQGRPNPPSNVRSSILPPPLNPVMPQPRLPSLNQRLAVHSHAKVARRPQVQRRRESNRCRATGVVAIGTCRSKGFVTGVGAGVRGWVWHAGSVGKKG